MEDRKINLFTVHSITGERVWNHLLRTRKLWNIASFELCSWHSFQPGSADAGSVLSWQLYLSNRGEGQGIPAWRITALSDCHWAQSVHLLLSKPTAWAGCHLCVELGQIKFSAELCVFLHFQGRASAPEPWIMQRVISEEKSFSIYRAVCMWRTVCYCRFATSAANQCKSPWTVVGLCLVFLVIVKILL